jgi:hypothetical protein
MSDWPAPVAEQALHGPAGEFVLRTEPHSEAHSMALLAQFLVAFGCASGRGAHYQVEADRHYSNEFVCAARRLVVSPVQPGVIRRKLLSPMAYPDPQGERDKSMPGNRRSCPGVRGDASWDSCDMAKAKLPEPQSPEDATFRPSEKTPDTGAMLCDSSRERLSHLRSVELCPVRAVKEMSGAPKSRSDVQQGRTRDQPSGRESQGDGMPVVVVGVTTHQGGRESRPQGEGA